VEWGTLAAAGVTLVGATLVLIRNRAVADYFTSNNTTPFTSLRPQDRLPREDRPDRLCKFRKSQAFWRPLMRIWVVVVALATVAVSVLVLAREIF